jgi:hypothetical protein
MVLFQTNPSCLWRQRRVGWEKPGKQPAGHDLSSCPWAHMGKQQVSKKRGQNPVSAVIGVLRSDTVPQLVLKAMDYLKYSLILSSTGCYCTRRWWEVSPSFFQVKVNQHPKTAIYRLCKSKAPTNANFHNCLAPKSNLVTVQLCFRKSLMKSNIENEERPLYIWLLKTGFGAWEVFLNSY